jgi:hypothetical protein
MTRTQLLRKFIKTRMALAETMQRIMDLNKFRKKTSTMPEVASPELLAEELKVLNATAEIQATVLKRYESKLKGDRQRA